ncbi:MAG TPA: hypothetical protein DCL95_05750, partial [Rhodospirillaceae bacterium]|nr:hypothetical protein [Rhodospirillaceae bacterium]
AAYRRLLPRAIKTVAKGEGILPILDTPGGPGAIKGPIAIDTLAPHDTWRSAWLASEQKRREAAPWYFGTDSIAAE